MEGKQVIKDSHTSHISFHNSFIKRLVVILITYDKPANSPSYKLNSSYSQAKIIPKHYTSIKDHFPHKRLKRKERYLDLFVAHLS
jgi:hypothetical protein